MDDPVLRVQSQLTDRDRVLLGWLYDHGVLTSFQIAHALFSSLDFCQRRLRTLHRLRLVARFRPQRAEGGSYPYHYVMDQLGAEVVAAGRDDHPPRRDHARTERRRWTSSRTLTHRLGVNQFFTDLARPRSVQRPSRCRITSVVATSYHRCSPRIIAVWR